MQAKFTRLLRAALAALLLSGLAACGGDPDPSQPQPQQSPNDTRAYRHLQLENGMRALLISDPEADKAAASLTVFRGSFDDPDARPGLAHFLEHMLFIGTEKYPEPDGYFKFIQAHGGSANAYTAAEHTNYFFDVQPEHFREALDRFAHFFIAPTLDQGYVEKEKNAVHSEYQLHLKDDGRRSFAAFKTMLNPAHPLSRFNIGSLATLSGDVHGDLLAFLQGQYSANQMGLVVLGQEPLDEMQPWVAQLFEAAPNRNLQPVARTAPLFAAGSLPATLRHPLLKDERRMTLYFPMPAQQPHYRTKPMDYLASLLGHEGEGSLHWLLTQEGWATSLAAGVYDIDEANAALTLDLELTSAGWRQKPRILRLAFDYLALLRQEGLAEWRYEEQAQLAALGFRYREASAPRRAVSGLSPRLQRYPAEDLLIAPYLMEAYDPALMQEFMGYLREDNAALVVAGPEVQGQQEEKWFSVPYTLEPGLLPGEAGAGTESAETGGAPEKMEADPAQLALPEPNPYLPQNLALLAADPEPPLLALADETLKIYLDTDTEFGAPRGILRVSLRNPGGLVALDDQVRAALYRALALDDLNPETYAAGLAGLGHAISAPAEGFALSVSGYDDKLFLLFKAVLDRLMNLQIDPQRFALFKETMTRDLRNAAKERPYQQALERMKNDIVSSSWTPEQQLAALAPLTPAALAEWRDRTLASLSAEALLLGNLDAGDAEALAELLRASLPLAPVPATLPSNRQLAEPKTIALGIDHQDAAMVLYVQDDSAETKDRALTRLLLHILRPAYFASLRTEQQLGYVVAALPAAFRLQGGMAFVIQSPVAPPAELKARTSAFLDAQQERFQTMPAEEFARNQAGLIAQLTQKDNNLGERGGRYWRDLTLGITTFDGAQQLADAVAGLEQAEVAERLALVRRKLEARYLLVSSQGLGSLAAP